MADKLTSEQIEEYKLAFAVFDQDGSGKIVGSELSNLMTTVGQKPTEEELKVIIMIADLNDDKAIDFDEFLTLMGKFGDMKDDYQTAFKIFDKDGNGFISKDELLVAMKTFGGLKEKVSDDELNEMLKEIDVNGDGKVNYEEFVKMLESKDE